MAASQLTRNKTFLTDWDEEVQTKALSQTNWFATIVSVNPVN